MVFIQYNKIQKPVAVFLESLSKFTDEGGIRKQKLYLKEKLFQPENENICLGNSRQYCKRRRKNP